MEEKVENLKDRISRAQQGLALPKKVNVQPTIRQETVRSEADAMKAKLLGLKK